MATSSNTDEARAGMGSHREALLADGAHPRVALLVGIGLIFAALVWAGVFLLLTHDRASEEAQAFRAATNLASILEEHGTASLGLVDEVLRFAQHELEAQRWQELAEAAPLHRRVVLQLAHVDTSGRVIRAVPEWSGAVDVADADYFTALRAHHADLWVGKPVPGDGQKIVPVARRLTDAKGAFAGVVVAAVDPAYFGRIYARIDLPPDSAVGLAGLDGIVRMRRINGVTEAGADVSASPVFRALAAGPSTAGGTYRSTSPVDGVERVHAFTRLPDYPLVAMVGISTVSMVAAERKRAVFYFGAAGIATLALALLVWTLARRVVESEAGRRRAERASKAKSDLLAHVSHELRTPLHGILGFAEYLERRLANPRERESAALIHRSGQQLLDITNLVLDLARAESGRLQLELADEDVCDIVRSTAAMHESRALAKGLRLEVAIDASAEGSYRCDRMRLKSVLGNLLDNAVKFTEHGGVRVSVRRASGVFYFRVIDTGPGIPPHLTEAVFERFEQGDAAIEARRAGSGLGLALVRELLRAMNGAVSVSATPGGGTTFDLRIPMPQVAPPASNDAKAMPPSLARPAA